mgnify:CR=1 FL=1
MQDRIPTPGQEGRVLITPEDGSAPFYATVEMADNPTQAGTPLNKETLLQDGTEAEIFGDTANRTVDEAFMGIMGKIALIMQNVASMTLTVTDTAGTPLQGVYVSGIFDEDGNAVATNASGQIAGYVAEGTTNLSVSGYADIANYSEQFEAVKGQSYTKTIAVTTRNFLKMTSTQSVRFSGNVEQVDVTAVGGGGGAAESANGSGTTGVTGGAGGGGYCVVEEDVTFTPNTSYSAVVGAGGNKSDGGTSSFLGVSAAGGKKGEEGYAWGASPYGGTGGAGNGKGGNGVSGDANASAYQRNGNDGVAGTVAGYSSFTETVVYGGGGGTGNVGPQTEPGNGAGYGGDGGQARNRPGGNGHNGTDGFGGGAGSGGFSAIQDETEGNVYYIGNPGRGGSGCIAIRMHLKSAA